MSLLLLLFSSWTFAFPELIKHGYTQCSACHQSRAGGDLLTEYGKELAKELASQHKTDYFRIPTPEWLQLGADMRLLQVFVENSQASRGRFIIMQGELNALFKVSESVRANVGLGRYEPKDPNATWKDFAYLPSYWMDYTWRNSAQDQTVQLKAGRFLPSYGLNIPEHTYVSRLTAEFTPGQERTLAEVSWDDSTHQVVVDYLLRRHNYNKLDDEKGGVLQVSRLFTDQVRLGANFYRSEVGVVEPKVKKSLDGIFGLFALSKEWAAYFQLDRINQPTATEGASWLSKFSYDWSPGVELFATQEYLNADTRRSDPRQEFLGFGVDYFPWTHTQFTVTVRNEKNTAAHPTSSQVVWLMFHGYL